MSNLPSISEDDENSAVPPCPSETTTSSTSSSSDDPATSDFPIQFPPNPTAPTAVRALPFPPINLNQGSQLGNALGQPLRRVVECAHSNMVRVYSRQFACQFCHRVPREGYIYRCTQDRELIIADQVRSNDDFTSMDAISQALVPLVKPAIRGPERRAIADRETVLSEMRPGEAATYTDAQIGLLVEQRKKVLRCARAGALYQKVIHKEKPGQASKLDEIMFDASLNDARLWVPSVAKECLFKACQSCRSFYAERAYLSLDGIANGDVPASAAIGYGFHLINGRPISNAEIAKNLGCRPVPRPGPTQQPGSSLMELIEAHSEQPRIQVPEPGKVYHFTGCGLVDDNRLASARVIPPLPSRSGCYVDAGRVRLQGSPPSAMSNWATSGIRSYNGHSPTSPKNNLATRQNVNDSNDSSTDLTDDTSDKSSDNTELGQPQKKRVATTNVRGQIIADPMIQELLVIEEAPSTEKVTSMPKSDMERAEEEQGTFGKEPLIVPDGIAVTEEAVQTGIPDIAFAQESEGK